MQQKVEKEIELLCLNLILNISQATCGLKITVVWIIVQIHIYGTWWDTEDEDVAWRWQRNKSFYEKYSW